MEIKAIMNEIHYAIIEVVEASQLKINDLVLINNIQMRVVFLKSSTEVILEPNESDKKLAECQLAKYSHYYRLMSTSSYTCTWQINGTKVCEQCVFESAKTKFHFRRCYQCIRNGKIKTFETVLPSDLRVMGKAKPYPKDCTNIRMNETCPKCKSSQRTHLEEILTDAEMLVICDDCGEYYIIDYGK